MTAQSEMRHVHPRVGMSEGIIFHGNVDSSLLNQIDKTNETTTTGLCFS